MNFKLEIEFNPTHTSADWYNILDVLDTIHSAIVELFGNSERFSRGDEEVLKIKNFRIVVSSDSGEISLIKDDREIAYGQISSIDTIRVSSFNGDLDIKIGFHQVRR